MPSSTLLAAAEAAPPRRRQRRHGRPLESVTLRLSVFRAVPLPSRDWAELPPELISSVLHRLDPVQIMLAADKVCRSWRRAARDEPELWRRVDMRGHTELAYRNLVDLRKMAVDAVSRSRGQCEAFCGQGFAVDDDFIRFLADQAPSLKSLINCGNISVRGFLAAIQRFPQLEELELSECWFVCHPEVLPAVAKACPRLKHLRLSLKEIIYFDSFGYDRIDDTQAMAIATMHQLRSLQLINGDLSNRGLAAIVDSCLNLESIDIRNCRNISMDGTLRAKCARIKTMKMIMDHTHYYERQDIDPNLPINECDTCYEHFGHIKEVRRKPGYASDPRASTVIATVREVRSLLLDRNDLTDRGLSPFLDKCPHLEFLDIRNCRDIILNNTLGAKNARMKTKKLTTKILCRDPCSLNTFNPEALDIRHCRKIIMNSWWYKHIMNNGSGDRYSPTILRKRIRNYHRKNKQLMAELIKNKNYMEEGSGREDLRIIKNMERLEAKDYISMDRQEYGFGGYNNYKRFEPGCPISECSTCLMSEYFAKDCDGLGDDDDYADYYDPSYGLNNLDETDLHVIDSMIDKRLRRYLKME
ncbi:hypothetical protein ACP70R_047074 [Stipagrostis hirtigluma subsp. patula]